MPLVLVPLESHCLAMWRFRRRVSIHVVVTRAAARLIAAQKAMAFAMLFPDAMPAKERGAKGGRDKAISSGNSFSKALLSKGRTGFEYSEPVGVSSTGRARRRRALPEISIPAKWTAPRMTAVQKLAEMGLTLPRGFCAMPSAVRLREDYSAEDLRALARRSTTVNQSRRLLSLAAVRDGMDRGSAAKICGMDREMLRDWVHRFNASDPEGLIDNWTIRSLQSQDPLEVREPRVNAGHDRDLGLRCPPGFGSYFFANCSLAFMS